MVEPVARAWDPALRPAPDAEQTIDAATGAPLLTIVVPWAGDPLLARLVATVAPYVQLGRLRVIVSVDGPLDPAAEGILDSITETAKGATEGFTVVRQALRQGPGAARNAAIDAVATPYLSFADADDLPQVEQLASAAELGFQRGLDVVIGGFAVRRDKGADVVHTPTAGSTLWSELLHVAGVWRFVLATDLLRRSDVRFPQTHYGEDLIFLLRVNAVTRAIGQYSGIVYTYNDTTRPERLTRRRHTRGEVLEMKALLEDLAGVGDESQRRLCNYWLVRIAAVNRSPRLLLGAGQTSSTLLGGDHTRLRYYTTLIRDALALHWLRHRRWPGKSRWAEGE